MYPLQLTIDLWNTATLNLWIMMTLSFTEKCRHSPANRKTYIFKLQIERWLKQTLLTFKTHTAHKPPPQYLAPINNSQMA